MVKLKVAIQKSGRLNEDTLELLKECGICINNGKDQLMAQASNFPLEVLYLRNSDIPHYVEDGIDVLKYRLENEYGCEIRLESLPYGFIRWVGDPTTDVTKLKRMNNVKAVKDMKGNPLLLFVNDWMIRMVLEDNEGLELLEFKKN